MSPMPNPEMVERVRKELESVPKIVKCREDNDSHYDHPGGCEFTDYQAVEAFNEHFLDCFRGTCDGHITSDECSRHLALALDAYARAREAAVLAKLVKAEEIIYGERGLGTALRSVLQCVKDHQFEEGEDPRLIDAAESLDAALRSRSHLPPAPTPTAQEDKN
jgi:hypothetical protein